MSLDWVDPKVRSFIKWNLVEKETAKKTDLTPILLGFGLEFRLIGRIGWKK
jgi:hypothetical protein